MQGVAQLFSGLKQKNKKTIWLLIAFLLPIAFQVVAALINLGLGGNEIYNLTFTLLTSLALFYPNMFFFGGPTAEEPGWRGFATPQMQKWFNPLFAGLLIGVFWTAWHLPLYVTGDYTGGISAVLFRFVFNVPLGVLFSWVYNKSGGNLLASILLHTSNNIGVSMFGPNTENLAIATMIVFTVIVVIASKMWRKTDKLQTIQTSIPAAQRDNGIEKKIV
jgi:membrane protease YdiL (CAAX protease family)